MGLRGLFSHLKNKDREQQQRPQTNQDDVKHDKQTIETSDNQLPKLAPSDKLAIKNDEDAEPTTIYHVPGVSINPLARSAWNHAYDELANDDGTKELVEAYMKTIRQASKPDGSTDVVDQDISEIEDQVQRDKILKDAIKSGQERIRKATSATNTVGKVSGFVLQFKDVIDFAVGTNPQAALPWAGVCIGLTFLLNPAKASQDNLTGIGFVASRMEWYCSLTDKLLSRKYVDTSKDQSYEDVLKLLGGRIIDLYKELLLFQIKSVCSYYSNQGWAFIRNLINLDGWDGQLESVKSAESAVKQDSEQFLNVESQELMRNLAQTAQAMQETLGDFHQTLQGYITEQRQKYQNDELGQCLKDLYVIDPQAQMSTIQGKNDRLVSEVYKWVLHIKEYQALDDWNSACQVLWLHGPAGTGKTMLTIGIISEMFARPSNLTSSISYFFCEARGEGQSRAVEVLQTLIWGLLIQQPLLFSHLAGVYSRSLRVFSQALLIQSFQSQL